MDESLVGVDTVDHESSTPTNIVDRLVRQLLDTSGFNNDIEPVRVVLLQLRPLSLGVLPVELDVLVSGINLLGDVHLDALVGNEDDPRGTVELEKLGEDKARGASTKHENFDTNWGVELVETMDGACGGLEEGSFLIGEVIDLV